MKYKYSFVFLSILAIFLAIPLILFLINFSKTETIPYVEYIKQPYQPIEEEEPFVRPESWDREIPPTTEKGVILQGNKYTDEKFGFEITVPEESFGTLSEGGLHNIYQLRLQNYEYAEMLDEYRLREGQYFLEIYVSETTETDPEKCVSANVEEHLEVDLGQGVIGYMGRPAWYGGDGPSNGVTLCTIKDGYEYDVSSRETTVFFDDEIVNTFRFID